jgi:hypothetical protein
MALTCGDVATGRLLAEKALELHRTLGDDWGTALSLLMFAYGIGQEGDWPRAQQLFEESVKRFRDLGDDHYALRGPSPCLGVPGAGDLERARELFENILRQTRVTPHELVGRSRSPSWPTSPSTKGGSRTPPRC